ncbi:MAG: hypothetical protein EAZ20_00795 [Bacteroidetes bacterium]|nr:MAG: hypothetical protein EAZ20_00795 [Bacteroidota bacterium]
MILIVFIYKYLKINYLSADHFFGKCKNLIYKNSLHRSLRRSEYFCKSPQKTYWFLAVIFQKSGQTFASLGADHFFEN